MKAKSRKSVKPVRKAAPKAKAAPGAKRRKSDVASQPTPDQAAPEGQESVQEMHRRIESEAGGV